MDLKIHLCLHIERLHEIAPLTDNDIRDYNYFQDIRINPLNILVEFVSDEREIFIDWVEN